jgi:TIGR00159 family protein
MLLQLRGIISTIGWRDVIDIVLVAVLLYKLYMVIKDTRALTLLKGLIVLLVATLVSKWLGLNVINWLLQKSMTVVLVALPIVFQPELRRALEQLGRGRLFGKSAFLNEEEAQSLLEETVKAVAVLAKNKIGALLVFERETRLNDFVETGIKIDGLVSSEFFTNIFIPNTPLHDGAVIVRGNRIAAAGCILPLTDDPTLSKELGTRHRAALGISEQSDAIIVVVSEETGIISVAESGRLLRYVEPARLKDFLRPLYFSKSSPFSDFFNRRSAS